MLHGDSFNLNQVRGAINDVSPCICFVKNILKGDWSQKLFRSSEEAAATVVRENYKNMVVVLTNRMEAFDSARYRLLRIHPVKLFKNGMETTTIPFMASSTGQQIFRHNSQLVFLERWEQHLSKIFRWICRNIFRWNRFVVEKFSASRLPSLCSYKLQCYL